MLSSIQEKLVRSLRTRMNRQRRGLCLVEGKKLVEEAGQFVVFSFRREDTPNFDELVSTDTPQPLAAVARLPTWKLTDIESQPTILLLDGAQDPGNVGTIMRLCLGFSAGLLLVESAEVGNPKTIRSSAGALFKVPWVRMNRAEAEGYLADGVDRPVFRLEKRAGSLPLRQLTVPDRVMLIAGAEGRGIRLSVKGTSVAIEHEPALESLNVGQAAAIALYARYLRT